MPETGKKQDLWFDVVQYILKFTFLQLFNKNIKHTKNKMANIN